MKSGRFTRFTVSFGARTIGALGVFSRYTEVVDVPDEVDVEDFIKKKLYEKYEHIGRIKWTVSH